MRWNALSLALLASWMCFSARVALAETVPSATLSISAEAIQPSDMPIIVTLTIMNTGTVPIAYWCGGPGDYPDAMDYCAKIQTMDGAESGSNVMRLSNGQQADREGRLHPIAAGELAPMPALLPPLPIGKYRIIAGCPAYGHVEDSKLRRIEWPAQRTIQPVEIEIRDDPALRDQRDRELLSKVRAADPFSHWMASTFPRPVVHMALSEDLMSANLIVAERAMDGLWGTNAPSETNAPLVLKAIQTHLKPPADGIDYGMMGRLLDAASHDNSLAAQQMIVKAIDARPDAQLHAQAVRMLVMMRLNDTRIHLPAVPTPPEQYDQDAIAALLKLSISQSSSERQLAYILLSNYPKSPQAVAAIRAGIIDRDPSIQNAALGAAVRMDIANGGGGQKYLVHPDDTREKPRGTTQPNK